MTFGKVLKQFQLKYMNKIVTLSKLKLNLNQKL